MFTEAIKKRKEERITQKELAKLAGVSLKTINRYENNKGINVYSEKKILQALDIDFLKNIDIEKNIISFDKQAENYNDFRYINQKDSITQLVNSGYPYRNKTILDLGSGTGFLSREIAKMSKDVYALDISQAMINKMKILNKKYKINNLYPLKGDAHNLPFMENTFDLIFTRLTLHHFKDIDLVLKEIKRVLKKNGELIIVDIVSSENSTNFDLENAFNKIRDVSHNKFFRINEIKKKLKEFKFSNLKVEAWKEKREFDEWISLAKFKDSDKILFNLMKGFATHNIDIGINITFTDDKINFIQKMVLIKAINIK